MGADVTSLGSRGTATWIRFVLQQPQAALPGSTMPHPDLRPDEIEALVAYILDLQSDSGSDAP